MQIKKIFSLFVIVVIFSFLLNSIFSNLSEIQNIEFNFKRIDLLITVLISLLIYPTNALTWHLVLRSMDVNNKYLTTYKIWVLSNASRYIPGGFWHYLGRVYLARNHGIEKSKTLGSIIVEIVATLFSGMLIVVMSVLLFGFELDYFKFTFIVAVLCFLLITVIILASKKINVVILKFVKDFSGKKIPKNLKIKNSWIPIIVLSCLLQFFIDGVVLFLVGRSISGIGFELLPIFIGIFAFSWMIGYLSFITPAGFGIQELSIATLLSLYIPFPVASLIAIIFRLCLIFSEIVSIGITFILSKFKY